jgi:hypothetical protein
MTIMDSNNLSLVKVLNHISPLLGVNLRVVHHASPRVKFSSVFEEGRSPFQASSIFSVSRG